MSNGKLKYPDEVYEFIKENYGKYKRKLLPLIKERFCVDMTWNTLRYIADEKLGVCSKGPFYSKEEEEWLRDNAYKYKSHAKITEDFNNTFPNRKRSNYSISVKLSKMGIKVYLEGEEGTRWILENAPYYTSKELEDMHNSIFDKKMTAQGIKRLCNRYGTGTLSDKDAKYDHFQDKFSKEIGTIVIIDGIEYVKVIKSSSKNKIKSEKTWIPRKHYEYEKHYGIRPKNGDCVVHLDGDKTNYSKENLYLIQDYWNGYIQAGLRKMIDGQPVLNKANLIRYQIEREISEYRKNNKHFDSKIKDIKEYIDQ